VLVLETSTCTIFFYKWLYVYFSFCILVPFKLKNLDTFIF
jgi:hypothetical protein